MRFSNIALAASAVGAASAQQSLCDKYTIALLQQNSAVNQYTVLTLLVNTAVLGNFTGPGTSNTDLPGSMNPVAGILAPGRYMGEKVNLAQYFDGSLLSTNNNGKAASVNFLDGGGATPIIKNPTSSGKSGSNQAVLLTHLYQFFGALLGCSHYGDMGFSAYGGDTNMYEVHQYMALSAAEFGYFVTQVGAAATSFGVTTKDATAVGEALVSTFGMRCSAPVAVLPDASKEPQAICIEKDCPKAKSPDCGAYDAVVEPKSASSGGGMGGGSGGGNAASTAAPAFGLLAAAGLVAMLF